MNELTLHPNVYSTGPSKGLLNFLERVWIKDHKLGDGTLFIVSGFGNYNGGVRFYETFKQHTEKGGKIVAFFAGSTSSRLTSKQVVEEMLGCGANVHILKRKKLLHAKCYGTKNTKGDESLIVTSGNFTGPGMSQNVELSVLLEPTSTAEMGFTWEGMINNMLDQNWSFYNPDLNSPEEPAWKLLYDEHSTRVKSSDDTDEVTMLLTLSHADTVRINAPPRSDQAKGSQYFWLSKDCYDFFPPLTIRNQRGIKPTYSCKVMMRYVDLKKGKQFVDEVRVTFEAGNNLDFRLGTGALRCTNTASEGDLAAISRLSDKAYDLRIYRAGSEEYKALMPFAVNMIGGKGKCYGYMSNAGFAETVGLPRVGKSKGPKPPKTH